MLDLSVVLGHLFSEEGSDPAEDADVALQLLDRVVKTAALGLESALFFLVNLELKRDRFFLTLFFISHIARN